VASLGHRYAIGYPAINRLRRTPCPSPGVAAGE
jgi:hypothetical protein